MAYNHQEIADAVLKALLEDPRIPLHVLAGRLAIDRHTIRRALVAHFNTNFRGIQLRCLLNHASKLGDQRRPLSEKEKAFALGYKSPTSFSRLKRRERSRNYN